MNERDAYRLDNAILDSLAARKCRFHYATVPAEYVLLAARVNVESDAAVPQGMLAVMLISEGRCLCGFVVKNEQQSRICR